MLRIKRLYLYVLQEFLPMFFLTFVICLFILLMQFLWKYVEDLVGKGLDTLVLAELFFYAILSIIPMALPLAILLASLMCFGNLGERFELTAIKAAGISLFRTMRPLILVVLFICIGAFFFQNEAMPKINVKITSLLRSIKIKSPELDIPEGSFYNEIYNYNLYVREKDKETGTLRGVMIYDSSDGFEKTRIIVCDSATLKMSSGKDYLLLTLFNGQQFANFDRAGTNRNQYGDKFVPYSRENFKLKEIIVPFDANFNRMDESSLQGSQIAKNIKELEYSIDSLTVLVDSMNIIDRRMLIGQTYRSFNIVRETAETEEAGKQEQADVKINFDSLLNAFTAKEKVDIYSSAMYEAESSKNDIMYRSMSKMNTASEIRYHKVEWHRKFTLSFACLVFFFIGAPLGAIIRKGGLGMPVVISVILFIFYYIIDNVGRKMARDGVWDAWQGIWLSSFVLFPLGVFLTYKAINDSDLFNIEAYSKYFRKILRVTPIPKIENESDVNVEDVQSLSEINADAGVVQSLQAVDSNTLKDVVKNYKKYNYDQSIQPVALAILKERGESFFGVKLKNINYEDAKERFTAFKKNGLIALVLFVLNMFSISQGDMASALINIVYLLFFVRTAFFYYDFYAIIDRNRKTKTAFFKLLGLYALSVIFYPYLKKEMKEDLKNIN